MRVRVRERESEGESESESESSLRQVIALVLCINVLWMAFELQLYGGQPPGRSYFQLSKPSCFGRFPVIAI